MGVIVDNRLAQDKIDVQIEVLSAELRVLKSRRNELSPVSQLPPEILRAIYAQVEECDPKKPPRPVILSHVCRFWRELVVSFPRLWTDIRMRDGTSPSLLDLMLKNSRKFPIQVSFDSESEEDSPILPALQGVLSAPERLQSLDLRSTEQILNLCLPHAQGRAESLEFLRIHALDWKEFPRLLANIVSGGTPNLRHLELEDCAVPWVSPLLLQSPRLTHLILRHLEVQVSPQQLLRVLRETPQLQFLDLKLYLTDDLDDNPAPIHLLNFRSLKIFGDLGGLGKFLRGIRIPMSVEAIDIVTLEMGRATDMDELLFALKSALGNPSPDAFISPRQLRVSKFADEDDDIETLIGIESWREFPILTTKAPSNLIHSPRGPTWKTFSVRTPDILSIDTPPLPLFPWQAQTAFWTLADLRYLEMNVSDAQPSTWAMFAQLPKLEEVVVGPENYFKVFFNALRPIQHASNSNSSLPRGQDPTYPFPSLRALVFPRTSCDLSLLHNALQSRQRLGACLEYLEFEGVVPSPGKRQRMSSVATNVVWKAETGN